MAKKTQKTQSPFTNQIPARRGRGRRQAGIAGTVSSTTLLPIYLATPEQRERYYDDMSALRTAEIQWMQISSEAGCSRRR